MIVSVIQCHLVGREVDMVCDLADWFSEAPDHDTICPNFPGKYCELFLFCCFEL